MLQQLKPTDIGPAHQGVPSANHGADLILEKLDPYQVAMGIGVVPVAEGDVVLTFRHAANDRRARDKTGDYPQLRKRGGRATDHLRKRLHSRGGACANDEPSAFTANMVLDLTP